MRVIDTNPPLKVHRNRTDSSISMIRMWCSFPHSPLSLWPGCVEESDSLWCLSKCSQPWSSPGLLPIGSHWLTTSWLLPLFTAQDREAIKGCLTHRGSIPMLTPFPEVCTCSLPLKDGGGKVYVSNTNPMVLNPHRVNECTFQGEGTELELGHSFAPLGRHQVYCRSHLITLLPKCYLVTSNITFSQARTCNYDVTKLTLLRIWAQSRVVTV